MKDGQPFYSIDTSALIDWWEEYTPDVFPGLLPLMEGLVAEGRLRAVQQVKHEIKDSDDELTLAKWCRAQEDFYLDNNKRIQFMVQEIMKQFQVPKKPKGISNADPFVIAWAALNGTGWHVVSSEKAAVGNMHKNPNIPFACNQIGVKHVRFLDMLRMEGWKLS